MPVISDLPREIVELIALQCDPSDLINLTSATRFIYSALDGISWRRLGRAHFGMKECDRRTYILLNTVEALREYVTRRPPTTPMDDPLYLQYVKDLKYVFDVIIHLLKNANYSAIPHINNAMRDIAPEAKKHLTDLYEKYVKKLMQAHPERSKKGQLMLRKTVTDELFGNIRREKSGFSFVHVLMPEKHH